MSRELLSAVKAVVLFLLFPVAMTVSSLGAAYASGSGSSGSFWIPYFDDAIAGSVGGKNGLFLIASNEITSSPAPKWITTNPVTILATAYAYGPNVSEFTPDLLMYASPGSNGEMHIYGLKLSDTAALPTPAQIGSLSLNRATQQICGSSYAQTDLKDPTTLFVVLGIGTPGAEGCFVTTQEVVHFTDSPTTVPEIAPVPAYQFTPLYDDGVFTGGVAYGALTGETYLYSFHSEQLESKPLASGFLTFPVGDATIKDGTEFGRDVIYFEIIELTGSSKLYRIDSKSLTLSTLATINSPVPLVGGGIADSTNFYYIIPSSTTSSFYQVPLAGGTPELIYTGSAGPNSHYAWIGSTGSTLVFQDATVPVVSGKPDDVEAKASLYTIPVGKLSSGARKIAGSFDGLVTGFVVNLTSPLIFANISHPLSTATDASYQFSGVAIELSGNLIAETQTDNSAFVGLVVVNSTPMVWQVAGITDSRGWGGGTNTLVDPATGATTDLTTTGGKKFTIPDGHIAVMADFINAKIAIGDLYPIASLPPMIGAAADLEHHFVYTVAMTNTNVSIY